MIIWQNIFKKHFNCSFTAKDVLWFENYDLDNIVTPVRYAELDRLLKESGYNKNKAKKLVKGFKEGFSLDYKGNRKVKHVSPNLPFTEGVGSPTELWNKVMKEVELKRYAGPYDDQPYEFFIQSPIGLVPKDKGKKTRLIFHLSYPRHGKWKSVNACIDKQDCKVKYNDFDCAVKRCLEEGISCHVGKSDMASAFRQVPLNGKCWFLLLLKAKHPVTGKMYWFVDKCLPFGSSISCKNFQDFSDAVAHITKVKTGKVTVNYLDDYLFASLLKQWCDWQMRKFLEICKIIAFPVSLDKTVWGTKILIFLGLLLDTQRQVVCIPWDKVKRAKELVSYVLNKKKITIHTLQKLCGFLNFLCRCVIPGRAFTMRLYAHIKPELKQHHHIKVSQEMKLDLDIWNSFLDNPSIFCRPFMEFQKFMASDINFYTDAAGSFSKGGIGGICDQSWMYQPWDAKLMKQIKPSIAYMELYAVTAAVLLWIHRFRNRKIYIFCDNLGVVNMINSSSSKEKNCMVLIRIITLESMARNVRVFAKHIRTHKNIFTDSLSRQKVTYFFKQAKRKGLKFERKPYTIPDQIWPINKIWLY